jgi:4-carboxymuconolactone decarboxylase
MTILRRLIFGEVFHTGDLDDQTRELITVVVLTTNQMLSQLAAHTRAALNVGVTPVEVREAVYECAPFIGFPATLNAMATVNDVFRDRGTEAQLRAHALGDIKVGNDRARQVTALIHCFPYIGFPRALNAIRIVEGS